MDDWTLAGMEGDWEARQAELSTPREEGTVETKPKAWLEWCPSCKRKHRVTLQLCSSCRVYDVPQPASEWVRNNCYASYKCDGCEAYEDHLR